MLKKFYFLIFISFCGCLGFSQPGGHNKAGLPSSSFGSPESSPVSKEGATPVDLTHGIMGVDLPLLSFNNRNVSTSVSVSYNASGIRVDDIATSVGLGWQLNMGGVITTVVNGMPDIQGTQVIRKPASEYDPSPYLSSTPPSNNTQVISFGPDQLNPTIPDDLLIIQKEKIVIETNKDYESDIFYFNFNGHSGKFLIDPTDKKLKSIPANPSLKIDWVASSDYSAGFVITDSEGNQYFFQEKELTTVSHSCSVGRTPYSEFDGTYVSSWYLSKIKSPNKSSIDFNYETYMYTAERGNQAMNYVSMGWNYSVKSILNETVIGEPTSLDAALSYSCVRVETITGKRILKISTIDNGSYVAFKYATAKRKDLSYNNQFAGNALEKVELYDNNQVLKDYWTLSYDYFFTGNSSDISQDIGITSKANRLKLVSLKNKTNPAYQFIYEETVNLPRRLSFSQDHWGYYNGSANPSLLPGASVNRDANFVSSTANSLKKIVYPTGSTSEFIYEPHTGLFKTSSYIVNKVVSLSPNLVGGQTSASFVLPDNDVSSASNFHGTYAITAGNTAASMTINVPGSSTTQIISASAHQTYSHSFDGLFASLPRNTVLSASCNSSDNTAIAQMVISWDETVYVYGPKVFTGGLRIKQVEKKELVQGNSNTISYHYEDPFDNSIPNAVTQTPPTNASYHRQDIRSIGQNTFQYDIYSSFYLGNSEHPLDNGYLYKTVTTEQKSISDIPNGRIISSFSSKSTDVGVTYVEKTNYEWAKGLLLKQTTQKYDPIAGNFRTVLDETYEYTRNNDSNTDQKTFENLKFYPTGILAEAEQKYNGTYSYNISSSRLDFTKKRVVNYDHVGKPAPANEIFYYYDNSFINFPTRVTTTSSENVVSEDQRKYPQDFAAPEGSTPNIYNEMVQRNIITPVIEETMTNITANKVLGKRKVSFDYFNTDLILPKTIEQSFAGQPLEKEMDFESYDNYGVLLQKTGRDGITHSTILGYSGLYPVAEITNAKSSDVFYTGFEDQTGGSYGVNIKAGSKYFSGSFIKTLSGLTNGNYKLSYWKKNGSNWELQSTPAVVVNGSYTINIYGDIDELRFYPENATIVTSTFEPLVGPTSICDINNQFAYNEYDDLGRLSVVRDNYKNVVKTLCYSYAGTQEDCHQLFGNDAQSSGFVRTNCSANMVGGWGVYGVPANKYKAYTKEQANQLALNDIAANGQNYINTQSSVPCYYINDDLSRNYYSQGCAPGMTPSPYYVSIPSGMFSSSISVADANNQATQYGQQMANQNGSCEPGGNPREIDYYAMTLGLPLHVIFYNVASTQSYEFDIMSMGSGVLGTIPMGTYNIAIYNGCDLCYNRMYRIADIYISGGNVTLYNVTIDENIGSPVISIN